MALNLRRLTLAIASLTVFSLFTPKMIEWWARAKFADFGVAVTDMAFDFWQGRVELTGIEAQQGSARLAIHQATLSIDYKRLLAGSFQGSALSVNQIDARRNRRENAVSPPMPDVSPRSRYPLDERLFGLRVQWQKFGGRVNFGQFDCGISVPFGQVVIGTKSPRLDGSITCRSGISPVEAEIQFQVDENLKTVTVWPRALNVQITPLKAVSFREAVITRNIFWEVEVDGLEADFGRIIARPQHLKLTLFKDMPHVHWQGGSVEVVHSESRSNTALSLAERETRPPILLDGVIELGNASLIVNGQVVGQIEKIEARKNFAEFSLKRGESWLNLSFSGLAAHREGPRATVSGQLQLADFDQFWTAESMVDGSIGLDGHYDFVSSHMGGEFVVKELRVMHPSLSMMPVHLPPFLGRFNGRFPLKERAFSVAGQLEVNNVLADLSVGLGEEGQRFLLEVSVSDGPCQTLVGLLPKAWIEELELELVGDASPKLRVEGELNNLEALRFRLRGVIERCRVKRIQIPWASPKLMRGGTQGHLEMSADDDVNVLNEPFLKRVDTHYAGDKAIFVGPMSDSYVSLSSLPPYVPALMYLSEEVDFFKNPAIDLGLLQRALRLDVAHKRYVYGGSTITQQLVKNLILDRRKTIKRKVFEVLISDRVYQMVSKERVLELYVNVIEFGPGVFGIAEAAAYYFQKKPSDLTVEEAVFLAMLKPSPSRGGDYRRKGSTPNHEYWFTRSAQLIQRLVDKGYLAAEVARHIEAPQFTWFNGIYKPVRRKK